MVNPIDGIKMRRDEAENVNNTIKATQKTSEKSVNRSPSVNRTNNLTNETKRKKESYDWLVAPGGCFSGTPDPQFANPVLFPHGYMYVACILLVLVCGIFGPDNLCSIGSNTFGIESIAIKFHSRSGKATTICTPEIRCGLLFTLALISLLVFTHRLIVYPLLKWHWYLLDYCVCLANYMALITIVGIVYTSMSTSTVSISTVSMSSSTLSSNLEKSGNTDFTDEAGFNATISSNSGTLFPVGNMDVIFTLIYTVQVLSMVLGTKMLTHHPEVFASWWIHVGFPWTFHIMVHWMGIIDEDTISFTSSGIQPSPSLSRTIDWWSLTQIFDETGTLSTNLSRSLSTNTANANMMFNIFQPLSTLQTWFYYYYIPWHSGYVGLAILRDVIELPFGMSRSAYLVEDLCLAFLGVTKDQINLKSKFIYCFVHGSVTPCFALVAAYSFYDWRLSLLMLSIGTGMSFKKAITFYGECRATS